MPKKNVCSCLIFVFVCATSSAQTNLDVQIENLGPAGGLFLTPVWVGFHDGGFDVFDVGGMASAELETIAEEGDIGPLSASFAGNGVDGGVAPGTPFGPAGSSFASQATATFNVNPTSHRYFSFASMVIPSNDAFIGNDNPTAFSLFDGAGVFQGPLVIEVTGQNIYDYSFKALVRIGSPAVPALLRLLEDKDEANRSRAAAALNEIESRLGEAPSAKLFLRAP